MNILNKATFGGGCFGALKLFTEELKDGGAEQTTANYKDVCKGNTGHAEVVQVIFDQNKVDYKDLLHIFFASHDPTTLNRQGEDKEQLALANEVIKELQKEYENPIVTQLIKFQEFYKAEDYHQGYYDINQNEGYCKMVISPKIEKIVKKYKTQLKQEYQ